MTSISKRKRIKPDISAWRYIRDVTTVSSENDAESIAMAEGERKYTYRAMFAEWHRYAAVFTALGMTKEKRARVGILGSTSARVVFSVYGLNMTGACVSIVPAYSALTPARMLQTIRDEKLTDFIISDDFAQPLLIHELYMRKKELGLNNIIVLHVPADGVCVNRMLTAAQEMKYNYLKAWRGLQRMDELLGMYGGCPVCFSEGKSGETAFILHTSGTTGGAGKPVPLSDTAFNEAVRAFYEIEDLSLPHGDLVTAAIVDLSNAYSMIDQVHLAFAMGACVVMVPGGILNPNFYKAIPHYGITFLFAVSAMFNRWMKMPGSGIPDLSSLKFVAFGGTAVSAADKRRYCGFLRDHGAGDVQIRNGYGISELGGACCLSSEDIDDDSIGRPLSGVEVRLYDEERNVFLSQKDAPCEGILYLHSPSMASDELDGKKVLKVEYVDGKPYICTNDLAGLDTDGRLTYLGRASRFYIHDDGIRYEAGRVETEFAKQKGIESCCVVPVYIKTTHDNIPMLCVKTAGAPDDPKDVIRKALCGVFITERTLKEDCIPKRVRIVDEFPRNGNGKIDLYKVNRGEVEGDIFTVDEIRFAGRLKDIRLRPYTEKSGDMIQEVFDGISAEMKNNLPFNRSNNNDKSREVKDMDNAKKMFEGFCEMNKQYMKMMNEMMGLKGGMPCMPDMDMMGSMMGRQMMQMLTGMQQMNQAAIDMMRMLYEQNCKMTEQFFDVLQKMNSQMVPGAKAASSAKEEAVQAEKAAAPANEKAAKAEKKPASGKKSASAPKTGSRGEKK